MFRPLADSASTDELPSSANVDERSERLSDMSLEVLVCRSGSCRQR